MHKFFRVLYYLFGMVLLAIGITLNTKTALGVSPLISIGYAVSQVAGLNFGNMTFVVYAAFVVIQFLLRRRNARWKDALQLLVALLFSQLLNVFDLVLAYGKPRCRANWSCWWGRWPSPASGRPSR